MCVPVSDRDTVVIPAVGSNACGRFDIVLRWERSTPSRVLSQAAADVMQGVRLVFCFYPLSRGDRIELARVALQDRRPPVLVVDEILLLFLAKCNGPGSRLKALFDCTLPFTAAEPYVTNGGPVPYEMFFGRREEYRTVCAKDGAALVYGGRQLGKTALLRRIKAELDGQKDIRVAYVDIRLLGRSENTGDIIRRIIAELRPAGMTVFTPTDSSFATFSRKIQDWLNASEDRRILVMLDEADAFLRRDSAQHYIELQQIKDLMDRTDRRFKVVFAGLQNVQRFYRDPNSPLAHFGRATPIGPMLRGDELREAERLVRQPLETLGFCFSEADAVSRLLAQCNYYPSLIQVFCRQLLAHARSCWLADPKHPLPFPLGMADVARVYSETDLRAEIRNKLQITLDLDRRYNYLVLLIALLSGGQDQGDLVDGLGLAELRDQALVDWPVGFGDADAVADFRALLDELVDLGLLRQVRFDVYALRNPNVLQILGDADAVGRRYKEALTAEPELDGARQHRRCIGPSQDGFLSPLSGQQEASLLEARNDVCVIAGLDVAGISGVDAAIRALPASSLRADAIQWFDGVLGSGDLRRRIRDWLGRSREGLEIAVVPPGCPWAPEWVLMAANMLAPKTSRHRHSRVLFLAGPDQAWTWLGSDARARLTQGRATGPERVHYKELALEPFTPAVVGQWIGETGIGLDKARILEATGGWSTVFRELATQSRRGTAEAKAFLEGLPSGPDRYAEVDRIGVASPVLDEMANMNGALTREDLTELTDLSDATIGRVVEWAEWLGLLRPGPEGYTSDPLFLAMRRHPG
jgi:hypothetical protein